MSADGTPIDLRLISKTQVSATLGQQALNEGLIAGIAGFIIVALFLLIFYRVLGLIAVGALLAVCAPFVPSRSVARSFHERLVRDRGPRDR